MIERIEHGGTMLAMIIRSSYQREGIEFFTADAATQQLGYMKRPAGYVIKPHVHNPVPREILYTQEVLLVRTGRLRVDFYSEQRAYLESTELHAGDVILLCVGGHGFEMLEPSEIVEVKQGPYAGDHDKTRFEPVAAENIHMRKVG